MTEFVFGPQKQGITTTNCNIELVERCDLVVMAVKPHLVSDILQEISDFFTNEKMFVSIAAGVPLEILETVSPIIQIPLSIVFICFVLGYFKTRFAYIYIVVVGKKTCHAQCFIRMNTSI